MAFALHVQRVSLHGMNISKNYRSSCPLWAGFVITFGPRFETVVNGQTEYQLKPTAYGFRLGARNHASGFQEGQSEPFGGAITRAQPRYRVTPSSPQSSA
jgi:hypothetical protein